MDTIEIDRSEYDRLRMQHQKPPKYWCKRDKFCYALIVSVLSTTLVISLYILLSVVNLERKQDAVNWRAIAKVAEERAGKYEKRLRWMENKYGQLKEPLVRKPVIKLAFILSLSSWDVAYKANVYTDYGKLRLTAYDTEQQDKIELRYSVLGLYQNKLTFNLGD